MTLGAYEAAIYAFASMMWTGDSRFTLRDVIHEARFTRAEVSALGRDGIAARLVDAAAALKQRLDNPGG